MENYNITPIGEKLRALRKKYDLKQEQIVGDDITRNLISQIENGKANLTRNTAVIIMSNLKRILSKKNILLDIDIEYLLENEETQAQKILDRFIQELNNLNSNDDAAFINTLKQAEEFLLEWDFVDKKIVICEIAGDYFCNKNDFYRAAMYYDNVKCLMNIYMDLSELTPVLRKLSMVYFYMGKYGDGIDICSYALERFPQMDKDHKAIFLFNSSLCYNYLQEYQKALDVTEKLEAIINENSKDLYPDKYNQMILLKASCLQGLKRYEKALEIYKYLCQSTPIDDYVYKATYLNNMCEINIEMGDISTAQKLLDVLLKNLEKASGDFSMVSQLHFEVGKRYLGINEYHNAEIYFIKAIKLAKEFKYSFVIKDAILELVHIPNLNLDTYIRTEFVDYANFTKEVKESLYSLP